MGVAANAALSGLVCFACIIVAWIDFLVNGSGGVALCFRFAFTAVVTVGGGGLGGGFGGTIGVVWGIRC